MTTHSDWDGGEAESQALLLLRPRETGRSGTGCSGDAKGSAPSPPLPVLASTLKVACVLVLVQVAWSGNAVYAKAGLRDMHVLVWYSTRLTLATPGFFVLAYFRERESLFRATKDWLLLMALGMLGMVINQVLFLSGLSLTTATNAGMMSPAISVFSTAISALLCLEKLSIWKLIGISITVMGALIILEVENFDLFGSNDVLLGNLLVLLSAVCFSFFVVLQKMLANRITPTVLNFFVFGFALLVIGPITLIGFWDEVVDVAQNAPPNAFLSTIYSALVAGVLGYSMNTWAIQQTTASNVALYYCLQALIVALLARFFLGEHLSARVAIGGSLVITGLFTVTWALDRQRRREASLLKQEIQDKDQTRSLLLSVGPQWVTKVSDGEPKVPEDPALTDEEAGPKKQTQAYGTFV